MSHNDPKSRNTRPCRNCGACEARDAAAWFGLEPEHVALIASARTRADYGSGQAVFAQGDRNQGVYCVSSGTVAIRQIDASGNSVLLKLCYAGDTLGYRSFLNAGDHKTSAEPIGPVSVCRIEAAALRRAMSLSPTLAMRILARAVADVDSAQETLMRQATLSNRGRLCQLLLQLAGRHGEPDDDGSCRVHLPVSRRDIASMIGTRHETISRVMARLEKDGLAVFSGRTVIIPRLDALSLQLGSTLSD